MIILRKNEIFFLNDRIKKRQNGSFANDKQKNEKTIVQNLCSFSFKYFGHVRLKEPQNCVPQKRSH